MANQFLNSGASRSELLAALMDKQNRRYSQQQDPSSIGEAFARTGTRLVDAYSQKKLVDDELERRQKQQGVDRKAYETAFSGTPEVLGYDQSRQDMTNVTGPDTYDALPMPPMSVLEEAIVGGSDQAYGQAMNTEGLSNQAFANLYNKRAAAEALRQEQAEAEQNKETFVTENIDGVLVQRNVKTNKIEVLSIPKTEGLTKEAMALLAVDPEQTPMMRAFYAAGGAATAIPKYLEKEQAKATMTDLLDNLTNYYNTLNEMGGIKTTNNDVVSNFMAGFSSSEFGQDMANLVGTDTQAVRNKVNATRPLLGANLQKALGLTGTQLNSNVELQQFMKAATNTEVGYEENINAINQLRSLFGETNNQQITNNPDPVLPPKIKTYNPETGEFE